MTTRRPPPPNRIGHSSGSGRRVWDGTPPPPPPPPLSPPTLLLSGGLEVALSGIKIGFTNPGPGVEDDLRLRYRPEAECISFEGPNSRGMLVPLEEMLLKDNLDGTISIFFRRQFRRKYYILEGCPPRVCDHIQAYKNELGLELHMLCYVTGFEPLTGAATFVRKQGRQNIPLAHRSTDFPAYSTYHNPQSQFSIPVNNRGPDEIPQPQYRRRGSYYPEPEIAERHPGAPIVEGPRVRFRDHLPPPVPQPPPIQAPRAPLRGGAGPSGLQFQEYEFEEEQFSRDPRDRRGSHNPPGSGGDSDGDQFARDPRDPRNPRNPWGVRDRSGDKSGFEPLAPREPRESRSRNTSKTHEAGERDGPELPPGALRNSRPPPRNRSVANGDRDGLFEPPPPSPTPQPQKRMFALVFRKSPADQGVEIRPASIDSTHEALVRQASSHWHLRELRLYGHVDGLKMNLKSQVDLDAYMKLCDGVQRLMVDVE